MKKVSKKEAYAANGVQFDKDKVFVEQVGWIRPVMKNNDRKTGKSVYTFGLLPTNQTFSKDFEKWQKYLAAFHCSQIKGSCNCHCKKCYAMGGNYQFPDVKASQLINQLLAMYDISQLERLIEGQIAADGIKKIRIHDSGDFLSDEYAEMWKRIKQRHPEIAIYTYTKTEHEELFDEFPNANVVRSLVKMPDGSRRINFGTCREMYDIYMALKDSSDIYLCPCDIPGIKAPECGNCMKCSVRRAVLFIKHGDRTYDVRKDPDLPLIYQIMREQGEEFAE